MLQLKNVSKEYSTPETDGKVTVLRDISLSVAPGESVAVVGPSGSGKSTLLNIIGALDRPTTGRVMLEGMDYADLDERALAGIRNQRIGFVFQLHHLLPQCTVMENVLIPSLVSPRRDERSHCEERAAELLERVGLAGFKLHRPGQLSGGQRQRVAVVRALINRPVLLLADEPTGSLDSGNSCKVMELLMELNRSENCAMVMVTHSDPAAGCAGRVFSLNDGELSEWDPS